MNKADALECENRADAATQSYKAYYQQPVLSGLKLDEALHAYVTLKEKHHTVSTQSSRKWYLDLSKKPPVALYTWIQIFWFPNSKELVCTVFHDHPFWQQPIPAYTWWVLQKSIQ